MEIWKYFAKSLDLKMTSWFLPLFESLVLIFNTSFILGVATDAAKPMSEASSSEIKNLSSYSAQLIVTLAYKRTAFRNISYKDMVMKAKALGVKFRGII